MSNVKMSDVRQSNEDCQNGLNAKCLMLDKCQNDQNVKLFVIGHSNVECQNDMNVECQTVCFSTFKGRTLN